MTESQDPPSASGRAGKIAELPPATHRPLWQRKINQVHMIRERERDTRKQTETKWETDRPRSKHLLICLCSSCPGSSASFGRDFPTSVTARKCITVWSHPSMEKSSEICTYRHLPTFHPVAFPTAFQSSVCWSVYRLQCRNRCSPICSVLHPHHQHLSSSQWPNRFRYVPTGACALFRL